MKRLRIFWVALLAVAATAIATFAGTASATTLTSPAGTAYTGEVVATSTNSKFDHPFVAFECAHSLAEGKVEKHGAETNAVISFSSLTFTECNYKTTVLKAGSLEVTAAGSVVLNGAEISIASPFGQCTYTTSESGGGSITGGSGAVWHINSAKLPKTSSSNYLCGAAITWTGSYSFTAPSTLEVD